MNSSSSPYPSQGDVIDGKYQIDRMLGEGGMGAVAKAIHLLRRAPVALKFMSPNVMAIPQAVERFLNEGVAASQIDSDHVVHIFDVGKLPSGSPYLVMEYMEGHDIAEVLAREGKPGIETQRAIYFVVQALRGLQVAHDAGIIHRDMKPSNCFVINKEGEPDFVKLLDFGISKVGQGKSASLTQTNSALGTPLYMSPEQAKSPRDVDLRSDLYSVGVILYELLTGVTPFTSESGEFTEILFKLFTTDPPPIRSLRPDLPPELAAVVHKALARDPNQRYSSAADFAMALEPWADARAVHVIQRLRAHQPGRGSQLPSESQLPAGSSVAAFSRLGVGTGTSPARTNETSPSGGYTQGQRHAALPEAQASRAATPREAVAATQLGKANGPLEGTQPFGVSGKHTDLGASRDTSVAQMQLPDPAKRSSATGFIVATVVVAILGGAGVWKMTARPAATAGGGTALVPDTPPLLPPPALPPPAVPSAPVVVVPVPSAEPSASAAATAAKKSASPPPAPAGHERVHLKDLKPIE
jgi:serine/threonine-protein kinase